MEYLLTRLELADVQVVAALHELRDARILVGQPLGHCEAHLYPVGLLLKAQGLHVAGIVGIIVDGGHRGELVVALDEHSLGVDVCKSERPHDVGHAALLAPELHGRDEGRRYLLVVDKIYPAEAHIAGVPCVVGAVVDDGGHTAGELAVLVGQKVVRLAELERGILGLGERGEHVLQEVGHRVGIVLVELVIEAYELPELLLGGHTAYFNGHITWSFACFSGKEWRSRPRDGPECPQPSQRLYRR